MTPRLHRWTAVTILKWVLACWGVCCFAAGIWIVNSQYAAARDAVIWMLAPLLVLTNLGGDIYIHSDPLHEELFVSTAAGPGYYLKPSWFGWGLSVTGLTMMLTASILIGRARRNRPVQLTQPKPPGTVRSGVENPAS